MTSKSDWRSVDEELMADERRKIEPPSNEQLIAYSRGELSPEEEDNIRERLAAYPELARALAEPFPTEGAEPGDPDYVSDVQFAADFARIKQRVRRPAPWRYWPTAFAVAAAIALFLGIGWWRTVPRILEPRFVGDAEVVLPDGARGPDNATTVHMRGESVVLRLPLMGSRRYADYVVEIVRPSTNERLWRSGVAHPSADDDFALLIHRRFADRGLYRIVVYGIAGESEQKFATYSVRIE